MNNGELIDALSKLPEVRVHAPVSCRAVLVVYASQPCRKRMTYYAG